MEKWMVAAKKADFRKLGEKFQLDPVTIRLIRNRDIVGEDAIREYLYGDLTWLQDPHLLEGYGQSGGNPSGKDLLREKNPGYRRL